MGLVGLRPLSPCEEALKILKVAVVHHATCRKLQVKWKLDRCSEPTKPTKPTPPRPAFPPWDGAKDGRPAIGAASNMSPEKQKSNRLIFRKGGRIGPNNSEAIREKVPANYPYA